MHVIKRDGRQQPVFYDKITNRNKKLAADLSVDTAALSQTVIRGLNSGMTTRDIDRFSAESAIHRSIYEPDYGILASRIAWNDLHKNTPDTFDKCIDILYNNYNEFKKKSNPLISEDVYRFAKENIEKIESAIDYSKDYEYSYFAFRTLEKSYLQKSNKETAERMQHMLMRVNLGIHGPSRRNGIVRQGDIDKALASYKAMSERKFIHATPTLFNAGTTRPQMSSCFLLDTPDSMGEGEYDDDENVYDDAFEEPSIPECWKHCAKISKFAGGIGVSITAVRCRGSYIAGTNGRSNGIIPLITVFNQIGRYVDQGGGKRKGAISIYLEPWHPDTPEFLEIRLPTGAEELRARDIFPALWFPDLFFKRIQEDGEWSFFCPGSYPELIDLYGEAFEKRYTDLEREGKMVRQMKARELWEKILKSLTESGLPYMLSKDSCNLKSNQKNVGTVRGSNLCVAPETYILTDKGQFQIQELSGQEVNVWNGEKWSKTTVLKTGEQQKLITVYLSNGAQITCTPYHKFIIEEDNDKTIKNATRIQASDLKIDMKLKTFSLPDKNQYSIVVVNIDYDGRVDDTYCFNEPENNAGIFNGILTGNCTEIIEYHDPKSIAVCNLASINLSAFVNKNNKTYDFTELGSIVEMATENLDLIIDKNYSPVRYCAKNNLELRPIGLGVQGLADTFAMLHISWESEEAELLNKVIFETIYYHALKKSSEMAQLRGSYSHFKGSPASEGILQYDMWGVVPISSQSLQTQYTWSVPSLDWTSLKENVKNGLRNSLLVAPMPTAGTSQIMGNNESFEPFTSNIYVRKVVAGDFPLVNTHLYRDLNLIGKWNKETVDKIIKNNGSVQQLDIPQSLKDIYKTVWEIPQKVVIDMAADRGAFIDQSQSMNIYLERPTPSKLSSMYMYGWKKGLKTLSYYLRSQPAVDAVKFSLMEVSDPTQKIKEEMSKETEANKKGRKGEYICTDEVCIPCSS